MVISRRMGSSIKNKDRKRVLNGRINKKANKFLKSQDKKE